MVTAEEVKDVVELICGLKAVLQEADQDRYNAVGVLEGDGTGPSLCSMVIWILPIPEGRRWA